MAARMVFQGTESSLHCSRILATTAFVVSITLACIARSYAGEIVVEWTAPGGDGVSGRAAAYDLRYSRDLITAASFSRASAATGVPRPGVPGTTELCRVSGLEAGVTYYFAIKTVDASGNWSEMSNVISGQVEETNGQEASLALSFSPPRPNPASGQTTFRLALPVAAPVQVEVFDVAGRRVRRLVRADYGAGLVDLAYDLRDDSGDRLPRGVYLVRAALGAAVFTRRLVVVH